MTKQETAQLLEILNAAYPTAFRHLTASERRAQVSVWQQAFDDCTADTVASVLIEYIRHNAFPPTIAGIRSLIDMLTDKGDDELLTEAWAAVCGNLRFDALSPENQIYFGNQDRINALGSDPNTVQTVFSGQHKKALPNIRKRVRLQKAAGSDPETLTADKVLQIGAGS